MSNAQFNHNAGRGRLEGFILSLRNISYIFVFVYALVTEPISLYRHIFTPELNAGAAVLGSYGYERGRPELIEPDEEFDKNIEAAEAKDSGDAPYSDRDGNTSFGSPFNSGRVLISNSERKIEEWALVVVNGVAAPRHCAYNGRYLVLKDSYIEQNTPYDGLIKPADGRNPDKSLPSRSYLLPPGVYSAAFCYRTRGEKFFDVDRVGPIRLKPAAGR